MSIEEKIKNKIKKLEKEMLEDDVITLEIYYQKKFARKVLLDLLEEK